MPGRSALRKSVRPNAHRQSHPKTPTLHRQGLLAASTVPEIVRKTRLVAGVVLRLRSISSLVIAVTRPMSQLALTRPLVLPILIPGVLMDSRLDLRGLTLRSTSVMSIVAWTYRAMRTTLAARSVPIFSFLQGLFLPPGFISLVHDVFICFPPLFALETCEHPTTPDVLYPAPLLEHLRHTTAIVMSQLPNTSHLFTACRVRHFVV